MEDTKKCKVIKINTFLCVLYRCYCTGRIFSVLSLFWYVIMSLYHFCDLHRENWQNYQLMNAAQDFPVSCERW